MDAETNKTLVCLAALCLPNTHEAADFLRALGGALGLAPTGILGSLPLLYDADAVETAMLERAEAMAAGFRAGLSREEALEGLVMVLCVVLRGEELSLALKEAKENQKKPALGFARGATAEASHLDLLRFNALTSVLLRRLALLLRVRIGVLAALEDLAIRDMQIEARAVQAEQVVAEEAKKAEQAQGAGNWLRMAKIGAVATAAGGLLAVTGGLAAPAIAAGLVGLGFAGTAALATTTTVAALLGTAGAGLGGWKMAKRTKGVTTFEFVPINTRDSTPYPATLPPPSDDPLQGMTVYICVSGFNRQPGPPDAPPTLGLVSMPSPAASPDFYGPWGAEAPSMTWKERMDRYYSLVRPSKRHLVPSIVRIYDGRMNEVCDALGQKYGVHPLHMVPEEANPEAHATGRGAELLREVLAHGVARLRWRVTQESEAPAPLTLSPEAANMIFDQEKPWDATTAAPPTSTATPEPVASAASTDEPEDVEALMQNLSDGMALVPPPPPAEDAEATPDMLTGTEEPPLSHEEELELEEEMQTLNQTAPDHQVSVGVPVQDLDPHPEVPRPYAWRPTVARFGDQFTLVWEPKLLLQIGSCFSQLVAEGMKKGFQESLKYTALSVLLAAAAWPLAIANFFAGLDEAWTLAVEAADEAGKLLATALMEGAHGERPVVLIGYSIGGRVIASCLTELNKIATGNPSRSFFGTPGRRAPPVGPETPADDFQSLLSNIARQPNLSREERQRRRRAATVVRDAVIVGAPVNAGTSAWTKRRAVVVGRLVNVYLSGDWVLSLLYRYKRWSVLALAGLSEVRTNGPRDVENFEVGDIVSSHGAYPDRMSEILQRVRIGDVDAETRHASYFL